MNSLITLKNENKWSDKTNKSFDLYCEKNNINLVSESEIKIPIDFKEFKNTNSLKKLLFIKNQLEKNKRVLYVDNDCFITSNCDNIFNKIPKSAIGCNNSGNLYYDATSQTINLMLKQFKELSVKRFNIVDASVIVLPKSFKKYLNKKLLLENKKLIDNGIGFHVYINYIIHKNNLKVKFLDNKYNCKILSKTDISNEESYQFFIDKLTTEIHKCDESIINSCIFNITAPYDNLSKEIIINNLASFYYPNLFQKNKKEIVLVSIKNKIQDIYSCGINLNVLLWYHFVEKCGYKPILTTHETKVTSRFTFLNKNYDIIDFKNKLSFSVINECKAYLQVGLSSGNLNTYLKKNKIPLIAICLGSTYYNDMFYLFNNSASKSRPVEQDYDQVWISPHFEYSKDYLDYKYNSDVEVCPYFWEDIDVKNIKDKILPFSKDNVKVGILESNINFYKHCIQPIIIADKAHHYVKNVLVFNTFKFKENPFFKSLINKSELFKNKKISFEKRYSSKMIFQKHCNVVISFSDNCDLNYLTLECLYLGIPVIHNAPMLKDYGYYYDKFDTNMGKEKLIEIVKNFDKKKYLENNQKILNKYSVNNKEYQKWFKNKMKEL